MRLLSFEMVLGYCSVGLTCCVCTMKLQHGENRIGTKRIPASEGDSSGRRGKDELGKEASMSRLAYSQRGERGRERGRSGFEGTFV